MNQPQAQPQAATIQEAQQIINNISDALLKQVSANNISILQLNKIYNLATNTGDLQNALTWL